ncbi:MAG: recombination mediator RecR [Parachlamydiaceae bacterium]
MKYPAHLIKLIEVLRKLPGVGTKSAERFAFQLLQWPDSHLIEMGEIISRSKEKLRYCETCGCLGDETTCHFCTESRMAFGTLCIIASPRDAFAIEETREFKGSYHVLGSLLSPMEGKGPEVLKLYKLKERLQKGNIREVVIAIDSTVEGDATALYLRSALSEIPELTVSRLAFGLPMGSSLDYVDGGTLARAFSGRAPY